MENQLTIGEVVLLILVALTSGALSGIVSPLILSFLQHKCIWKSQKKLEVKYAVFTDAVKALSLYAADASDPGLQSKKGSYKGLERPVELRLETVELLERSHGLVSAFFSKEASDLFNAAQKAKISIEHGEFIDFHQKQKDAIVKLSAEIGIK